MNHFLLLGLPKVPDEKVNKLCQYTTTKVQERAKEADCPHSSSWSVSLLHQEEGIGLVTCTDKECEHRNPIMLALHEEFLDASHQLTACNLLTPQDEKELFSLLSRSITYIRTMKQEIHFFRNVLNEIFPSLLPKTLCMDYVCHYPSSIVKNFYFHVDNQEKLSDYLVRWKEELGLSEVKESWIIMVDEKQYWGTWPDYEGYTIRSIQVVRESELIEKGLYPRGDRFTWDPFTISKCCFLMGDLSEKEARQLAYVVLGILFITQEITEDEFLPSLANIGWGMEKKDNLDHLELPKSWKVRVLKEKQNEVFCEEQNGWTVQCSASTAKLLSSCK